ncbi:hypothetical protein JXA85_02885 [Candidatus Woesearchaeota archaeon]|nr:hypothetical protein [Candidatus Woesearchaeota archaeon]
MYKMNIFNRIRKLFEKKKRERLKKRVRKAVKKKSSERKKPPKKEVLMPQPWSKVEKYKKVKTNNSTKFSY